jgi:translation initiation factor IF-3
LSRPFPSRSSSPGSFVRINGKIRAREVRVIGPDKQQLGILQLADAIRTAQSQGLDLVEIAPTANPPVCQIVDYGKFRYEQAKREKESKKHQHANKVKEVQLSPQIDPHDFGVKLNHAIDFLCEDMKVKVTLRFRGRELAHKEYGFQQVQKFVTDVAPWGHPDFPPKLIGKGINVMISPHPRNKRAKHPRDDRHAPGQNGQSAPKQQNGAQHPASQSQMVAEQKGGVANSPFSSIEIK